MNTLILAVIVAYTAITIFLGLWTRKRNIDSSDDYYLASRSVGWFHLGLTVFASWFSTFTFLGAPGFYFTKGVKWYVAFGFYTFAGTVLFWFFSRKIWMLGREKNYLTPADLLADFYQSTLIRYLVGLVSVLALVPYALIQLVGIGKAIEAATNGFVGYDSIIIATGVVTAFYVFIGGVRAILWTDIFQGILFALVIFVAMVLAIEMAGGITTGFATVASKQPDLFIFTDDDPLQAISLMTTWTLGFVTLPHLWQRSYMAKSAEHLVKANLMVVIGGFLLINALMITGILAVSFMDAGGDSDKLIVNMFAEHLPLALPLFILAAFCSGMSTVDSQLLTASSIFVRDLVKPIKVDLSSKAERQLGRIFLIVLITVLVILGLLPDAQGPIIALATKGTSLSVMLFIPLLGPTFMPSMTKTAALTALGLGSTYYILGEAGVITFTFGLTPFLAGLLLNGFIFLLFFLVRPRNYLLS